MKRRLLHLVLRALPVRLGNALLARHATWGRKRRLVESQSPEFKQRVLKAYARQYELGNLIETGTNEGATVEACIRSFSKIVSIELDKRLFRRAARKFSRIHNVEILHGDSAEVLPAVLPRLSGNCLFWLDAHHCGGITAGEGSRNPVVDELRAVLSDSSTGHVVLIDDARYLTGEKGWPTMEEIRDTVSTLRPDATVSVKDDIIRIVPP